MADVVTIGELLVDLVAEHPSGSLGEAETFVRSAGGAPANVAVAAARLGAACAFLGKVGDDPFGRYLASVLQREGVDVSGLRFDKRARTALAFVSLGSGGERSFTFFRHPSADMLYRPDELDETLLRGARVVHFGSVSLASEPSRSATLAAVRLARAAGALVSFDPNLRLDLWEDAGAARRGVMEAWPLAHVIKLSHDELDFLAGGAEEAAARSLMHDELRLLMVTRGAQGVDYLLQEGGGHVSGFAVEARDTTGAGDAFAGAMLAALAARPRLEERPAELEQALRRANAFAGLTVMRHGAINGMPDRHELERFLQGP